MFFDSTISRMSKSCGGRLDLSRGVRKIFEKRRAH
jgi:hypothetical protein